MKKATILVVDVVYDFTNESGLMYCLQNKEVPPRIRRTVDICWQYGALMVYLQHCYRKGEPDRNLTSVRPNCTEGSGGEEIDPSLEALPQDYTIKKRRYSVFLGTDLDPVLCEHDIRRAVVVGMKTSYYIHATVMDAYNLSYEVHMVRGYVVTNDSVVDEVHLMDIHKYLGHVLPLGELKTPFVQEEADETV